MVADSTQEVDRTQELVLNKMWDLFSAVKASPVTWLQMHPAYKETLFKFNPRDHPNVQDYVALTIDDGLCRDPANSMVKEVLKLLKQHHARATFFIIYDFFNQDDGEEVLKDGHEFGNHCCEDRSYFNDSKDDFAMQLLRANAGMQSVMKRWAVKNERVRWFRSPQGKYSSQMKEVIETHGMQHVLGNAYVNDFVTDNSKWIADQLLTQASSGSVIIIHIPERGHWEWNLESLRLLLEGLTLRGFNVVTLSELVELAGSPKEFSASELAGDLEEPYQDGWKTVPGYIAGPELKREMTTIKLAKGICNNLSSCAGFYFQGPQTTLEDEEREIIFCQTGDVTDGWRTYTSLLREEASKIEKPTSWKSLDAVGNYCITTHHGTDDVTGRFYDSESSAFEAWKSTTRGKAHLLISPSGEILKRWVLPFKTAGVQQMMDWRNSRLAAQSTAQNCGSTANDGVEETGESIPSSSIEY